MALIMSMSKSLEPVHRYVTWYGKNGFENVIKLRILRWKYSSGLSGRPSVITRILYYKRRREGQSEKRWWLKRRERWWCEDRIRGMQGPQAKEYGQHLEAETGKNLDSPCRASRRKAALTTHFKLLISGPAGNQFVILSH